MSSPKPLLDIHAKDPVGGSFRETSGFADSGFDYSYVPGYSGLRRQIDADMSRNREPTVVLTHRYQWVTVVRPNGSPDLSRVSRFMGRGYRKVHKDDLPGLNIGLPPNAVVTAEGYLRNGDCELMVCDAATAARNEAQVRSAIESQTADDVTSAPLHRAGQEVARVGEQLTTSDTQQRTEVTKG